MSVDRLPRQLASLADVRSDAWIRARAGTPLAGHTRYGADGQGRWPLLLFVCMAHVIGLGLLASAVIRPTIVRRPAPLRITLVPLDRAPPPAAPAKPVSIEATQPIQRETPPPIIAATPVMPVAAATPVVIAPAPVISPPAASPEAPSPAAIAPAAAAPLIPPNGEAATLHNPAPVYPLEARRRRQQGTVRLRVTVSVEGHVQDIAVARTSGFDLLDQAALKAVRRWTFVPGSRGGVPVEAVGSLAIPFKLV